MEKVTVSNKRHLFRTKEDAIYPDLLTETLEFISNENEVMYVIFRDDEGIKSTSWDSFKDIAHNIYYDKGFGTQEIFSDLSIVGKSWWLERHEYDGSEWWEMKTMPKKPKAGILKKEYILRDV